MRGWTRLRSHSSPQVLDVIAPPYTSDFVHLFLPILENDSIAGTIKTEGEHDPVTEFIGQAGGWGGAGNGPGGKCHVPWRWAACVVGAWTTLCLSLLCR